MNSTPAAELARLKVAYGARWLIARHTVEPQSGPSYVSYTARERGGDRKLKDETLTGLEHQLISAEKRRT